MRGWSIAIASGAAHVFGATLGAQHPAGHVMSDSGTTQPVTWSIGAQAIGVGTIASPAYADRTFREGYLTQPMLMGMLSAFQDRIAIHGMLDFEGVTLRRGELDAGMQGEGYVDRRHPHTYLHELVASASGRASGLHLSLAIGKGFAPFGTDDPMVRPFEKYPANHHVSQIVERLLATIALRYGPLLLEGARFNGDEPVSPSDWPNRNRLWDSWAARATVFPVPGVELQASHARVESPELDRGGGLDQRKWNASVRFEDERTDYALVEWGRSSDYDAGERAFSFNTVLAEGEIVRGRVAVAARLERTERPEEERLNDPFRTQRPSTDFSILGRTRWDIASVRASVKAYSAKSVAIVPFIELGRQHVTELERPSAFNPTAFYGSDTLWSYSAGLTISAGMIHRRTGTYGAAARQIH